MAERKFDYAQVAQNYKNMNAITGDAGNADSIAGIFDSINKEYEANVDVSEMAIFGDLGKQLLLDWKNTASNFPSFVDKFNSWSTVVVQSANDYSKFETEVKGFKDANPLGFASGGITQNHIESSTLNQYADANIQQHNQDAANLAALHALTPGEYERSDAQKALAIHKGVAVATCAADVVALLGIGAHFGGMIKPASTELVPVNPTPINPTPINPTPVNPNPINPTPVNPTPINPTPALPGATSTALSVVDDAATVGGKLLGKTGFTNINGELVSSTMKMQNGQYIVEMVGSTSGNVCTLELSKVAKAAANSNGVSSLVHLLRNLGFAI